MNNKIVKQEIEEVLIDNYMPYAVYTIEDRAIVGIDGLKPVHRRVLHSMVNDGLLRGARVKSATAVGKALQFHPHGDSSIYEAMVRLSQVDSLNLPLIDGKGNLGEHTSSDLTPAHMRYTEVKLRPIVKEIFTDLEKLSSLMVTNYDETKLEPALLPVRFPHVLINNNMGIATGMSSNICGFALDDVCRATIEIMKNPDVDIFDSMEAPDFPTGGELLFDKKIMSQIYETGRGSVRVRAKIEVNEKHNSLSIKEIPYSTTREEIIEKINKLCKDKEITEITGVEDLTGIDGMEIEVEYKKNTNVQLLINKLYSSTKLEDSFSCNFNILIDGKPVVLGVRTIIKEWLKFRKYCIRESIEYDIVKLTKDMEIVDGFKLIVDDMEALISILRKSTSEEEILDNLKATFSLNETQSKYIMDMKLKNINNKFLDKKIKEYNTMMAMKKNLKVTMSDDKALNIIIESELEEISKKYSTERKTKILKDVVTVAKEDLIDSYPVKLCVSKQGYFKKIKSVGYRAVGNYNLKENDELISVIDADNKDYVLMFTNKGNVIRKRVSDFEDIKMAQIGSFLYNVINLAKDEVVVRIVMVDDFNSDLFIAYENGNIAKIPLSVYDTTREKLLGAYNLDSKVVNTFSKVSEKMLIMSDIGKVLVFNTDEIPSTKTKTTKGVRCMQSKDGSKVTMCVPVHLIDEEEISINYYQTKRNAIGKYIRKHDSITFI